MKKYIPKAAKKVEGISENIMLLNKKNVGENASSKAEINAVFFPNISRAIRYVRIIIPMPNIKTINFPKNIASIPIFQKKPRISGHTKGLDASYNPESPEE